MFANFVQSMSFTDLFLLVIFLTTVVSLGVSFNKLVSTILENKKP